MALVVKNFSVNWEWNGDESSLRGFSVVIVRSDNPTAVLASREIAPSSRSATLSGVTVDTTANYMAGVQAHYVGKDSVWISSTGLSIPDDGSGHVSNDSITPDNLTGPGRVWEELPEDGATIGAEWGVNVVNQPTSLADLDPAVAAEIIDLQGQVDNKIAIFVQESTPSKAAGSWTDLDSNHVGDNWYKPSELSWYEYNGTKWNKIDSSIYNVKDLAEGKTTIHYASGTSTPSPLLGVLNDFCLYKNTSTGVMTFYKKTGTTTWTAQPGSYVEGADITEAVLPDIPVVVFPGGVQNSNTTYDELQGDKPPVDADSTATKLAEAGNLTLKGVLLPTDSGAIKVGSIVWNATSGAYVSGTGLAFTEAGIIGANTSGVSFSISTTGNAIFKGDITGASGAFSGTVSASNVRAGTITGSTLQTAASGKRFVVSASDGEAYFYNSSGAMQISLGQRAVGTDTWLGVFDSDSTTLKGIKIDTAGDIGISARSSGVGLSAYGAGSGVEAATDNSSGHAIWAYQAARSGTCYGVYSYCASSSGYAFYAAGSGMTGPFTGGHDSIVPLNSCVPGDILVDIEVLNVSNIVNTLCLQNISSKTKQKNVVGVYAGGSQIASKSQIDDSGNIINGTTQQVIDQLQAASTFDEFLKIVRESNFPTGLSDRMRDTPTGDNFSAYRDLLVSMIQTHEWARMASLGEGMINVVAEGGNIEAGDYICSSSTPGKGMKQDDDLMHNYTVAKAREDVVWTAEEIAANAVKMIACTYHCG